MIALKSLLATKGPRVCFKVIRLKFIPSMLTLGLTQLLILREPLMAYATRIATSPLDEESARNALRPKEGARLTRPTKTQSHYIFGANCD